MDDDTPRHAPPSIDANVLELVERRLSDHVAAQVRGALLKYVSVGGSLLAAVGIYGVIDLWGSIQSEARTMLHQTATQVEVARARLSV